MGSVVLVHGHSCPEACGIFPDQGSNLCPLHWRADSQPLDHQGSPQLVLVNLLPLSCSSPFPLYIVNGQVILYICKPLQTPTIVSVQVTNIKKLKYQLVVRKKTPNPWKAIMNDSVKIYNLLTHDKGFPVGSGGKESACQYRRHKRCGFDPWIGKIPWRRAWEPTAVFLPGESHGQSSLSGCSP